jgi:hypothetical protein
MSVVPHVLESETSHHAGLRGKDLYGLDQSMFPFRGHSSSGYRTEQPMLDGFAGYSLWIDVALVLQAAERGSVDSGCCMVSGDTKYICALSKIELE